MEEGGEEVLGLTQRLPLYCTAKPMINIPKLRELTLVVPPLPVQQNFAALVEHVERLGGRRWRELRTLLGQV